MIVEFSHDGRPVPWARTRTNKRGQRFTPPAVRTAKAALALAAKVAMGPCAPMDVPLRLELGFYFPLPRRGREEGEPFTDVPDVDNCAKMVMDSCNGVLWTDDRRVVSVEAVKRYSAAPRTEVRLLPLEVHERESAQALTVGA